MINKEILRGFYVKHDFISAIAIFCDAALILSAIAIGVFSESYVIKIICILVIGVKQYSIAECMVHEACHGNLFKNRKLNHFVGKFFATLFLVSYDEYCREHLKHHKYLGTDRDPLKTEFEVYKIAFQKEVTFFENLKIWFLRPLLGAPILYIYFNAEITDYIRNRKDRFLILFSFCGIVAACLFLGILTEVFLFWIFPMVYVLSACLYWSEIEDHFNVKRGKTRSNVSWLSNILITHNNGFHEIHHKYPGIPWYNLKRAHEYLKGHYDGEVSHGFLQNFKQTFRFRLS